MNNKTEYQECRSMNRINTVGQNEKKGQINQRTNRNRQQMDDYSRPFKLCPAA